MVRGQEAGHPEGECCVEWDGLNKGVRPTSQVTPSGQRAQEWKHAACVQEQQDGWVGSWAQTVLFLTVAGKARERA